MSSPFIGEIRLFAGTFAPVGWAFCDGSAVQIAENDALFALLGTTYGGDGIQTFNLPDLRGRVPLHQGQGAGLSQRVQGQLGGVEAVPLSPSQLPAHSHTPMGAVAAATGTTPVGAVWAATPSASFSSAPTTADLAPWALSGAGNGVPHENRVPYLAVNFIIALYGIFPSQS